MDGNTLDQLNATLPIDESAVELRVNVEFHWPDELAGADDATAWGIRKAHEAARDLLALT